MKIVIVQLSDIHVRDERTPIHNRAEAIRAVTKGVCTSADAYLLAYTGDLAFSGKKEQYEAAGTFCDAVKTAFSKDGTVLEVFIPGNHDLDFNNESDARPLLLDKVVTQVNDINLSGSTAAQLLSPQDNFFAFVQERTDSVIDQSQRFLFDHTFNVQNKTVIVKCLNTAWMSRITEKPGTLLFPSRLVEGKKNVAELVIAMLHHPYAWLEPSNARSLRLLLEQSCDVIFTGHEHHSSAYKKEMSNSQALHYIEGAVLCDSMSNESGFNVVVVNLEERSYQSTLCLWDVEMYVPVKTTSMAFSRNAARMSSQFPNNEAFVRKLADPGTPFRHPIQKNLTLRDIFVYPDLSKRPHEENATALSEIVESNNVFDFMQRNNRVFVLADEGAGKTSLAKILYEDYHASGLVPLYVAAAELDGFKERDVRKTLRRAFGEQYDADAFERFLQLGKEKKAILIDDWQRLKYNLRGQAALIRQLETEFDKVICFSTEILRIERLADSSATNFLDSFQFCDIREFGRRLRGRLIEKWHCLGQEFTLDEQDFAHAIKESENKINALIGKNLLPSYPLEILTMLQVEDLGTLSNSSLGSYGHLYEVLITRRLAEVSKKATELGTKYTYISRIAYHLLNKDRTFLSRAEIERLHEHYCEEYSVKLSLGPLLDQLRDAQIIIKDGDTYRFRYKACYCYFVAKYFQENLANDKQLRLQLNDIVDQIFFEDYSNIVMFFVFLTKDNDIITRVRDNAQRIYASYGPCDLGADVGFANALLKGQLSPLSLPPSTAAENRDRYRKELDAETASEDDIENPFLPDSSQRVVYTEDLNDVVKTAIAIKNLRIMGQILKNFPGVLKGGPKRELAKQSYLLGLRTLKRLMIMAAENLETHRDEVAKLIRQRRPLTDDAEIVKTADEAMIWLLRWATYAIIKRISQAIGLQELEITFRDVLEQFNDNVSIRLIDLAIKLDHFREPPKVEIADLKSRLRGNLFSYSILRDLVADYLHLFVSDTRQLQEIGAMVNIDASGPKFLIDKKASVGVH